MSSTLLISSRKDPAGTLIHQELCDLIKKQYGSHPDIKHLYSDERLIYLNGQDIPSDTDRILFLSRHSSEKPRPVLTVHVTGNFGSADYGGDPQTLTPADPFLMHALIKGLVRYAPPGYEVMYEATHHGPTNILIPSCFVEIGSTEKEWNDRVGAHAVAQASLEAIFAEKSTTIPLAGFGGTHYTQRQTEISKKTRGGFGHIMPTRDIRHLDERMFQEIISGSQAVAIYLDRKSLSGEEEQKILQYAKKIQIPVLGQHDLLRLKNLNFHEYLNIRNHAHNILADSTVIVHNLETCPHPTGISIPEDLIDEVMKNSPDEFLSELEKYSVVHLAGKGKACQAIFITEETCKDKVKQEITQLCITLLQSKFSCRLDSDSLVILKTRFDPVKAKNLGISPGPFFSELLAGNPVKTGDIIIYPDMVMTETEKRIKIV